MNEEIKKNDLTDDILDDDALEQVAGGTGKEIDSDIEVYAGMTGKKLNLLSFPTDYQ